MWRQLGAGLLTLSVLLSGCSSKTGGPTLTKNQGFTVQSWSFGTAKPGDREFRPPAEAQAAVERVEVPPAPAADWASTQWARIRGFGYELEALPKGGYHLYRDGRLVTEATVLPYGIAFSQSGQRFAWVLSGGELLTEKGKVDWHQLHHLEQAPFFIGEAMYWVQTKDEKADAFQVVREGEVLYEGALNNRRASIGLERFQPWQNHWVVETVEAQVIIDGKRLGETEGYQQVFFWRLFQGKPIYFYERAGQYGIVWDGKDLGLTYDQIFHGGCCDSSVYNPQLIKEGHGITLYVRQGDTWRYVLITQ